MLLCYRFESKSPNLLYSVNAVIGFQLKFSSSTVERLEEIEVNVSS